MKARAKAVQTCRPSRRAAVSLWLHQPYSVHCGVLRMTRAMLATEIRALATQENTDAAT